MSLKHLFKEIIYYKRLDGGLKRIGTKFILAKTPLKKWVNTSLYNSIYENKIMKKTQKIEPVFLQIENTNICNANCIMCPHTSMKREKKIMSRKDFEKIVDNVLEKYPKIKTLIITGFGEPFVDKEIIEKINFVNKKYPNLQIDIYTNANLLDKKIIQDLFNTKLHKINFSVNGTRETYKKMMGLDYEKTLKNILEFLELKKKSGKKFPLVNISLMIMKENEKDVGEFQNFWLDKADSVMIYPPSNWTGKQKINFATSNPFKQKRWPCGALWQFITVDVDGNLIMCCRDYESVVKFGNLLEKNIEDIFDGKKFNELRKKQLEKNFDTLICKNCDNCFDSSLNWWN
jgi:radical SAM protein with 4Fe4S-binding SPASM domain